MAVLTDILEWSAGRPMWQQDALRRIVTQGSLSKQDAADLCGICLAQRGTDDPENPAPAPNPLVLEHLPPDERGLSRIQLTGLREIQGVNALAANQRMGFELDGLTIVFGYNGSGKSGYARILRSVCHTRHRGDEILQDVFGDANQPVPSATVDYNVAGSDRSVSWQQGRDCPIELRQISFFDADCAAVHVDVANEIAFTPFGLDVLPKLANACQQLDESITRLAREQEFDRPASLVNPQAANGTRVRTMLNELDENSDVDVFRQLAQLSETETSRINGLREALGGDPALRARELRNVATRLQRLHSNIQQVTSRLSTEALNQVRTKLQDAIAKKEAAEAAAQLAFGGQPLSGVGEKVWQELWQAARNYSRQRAYPDQEFPFTGEDARCVLCQQPLDPNARERLTTFETFVKAETQRVANQAQDELSRALLPVQQLTVGHSAFSQHLSDLPEDQEHLRQSIRRFFGIAWKMRCKILHSCEVLDWIVPCTLPISPRPELDSLMQGLLERADELQLVATGEERQTLFSEQNDLLARQWLAGILDDLESEIARKKRLAALNAAKSDTVTTGITRKSSDLADRYVTDVLRDRLATEVRNLGTEHLQVELDSPGGRFGQKRFKVSLRGARDNTKPSQVLSDGEFRCIALAGFLAELSTEQSGSALVFDDPVCSLDHQWRRKVAHRLVQLACERQVIVFTHDIVFLTDLVGYCSDQGVPLKQSYLYRGPNQPGECKDSVPWVAMPVKKRIGHLKNWHQTARSTHRQQGPQAYESEARRIYGHLRESWERAIEEVLLNSVVVRFDRAIHTQKLRNLSDITDDDIRMVDEGMTKCSRFLEGHDEAVAVADPVPDPDELERDINQLETWVSTINRRR